MGYFCDYFRAPDDATALAATAGPGGPLDDDDSRPAADGVEVKGLEPAVMFGQLVAFVRGVPWTPDIPDLEFLDGDVGMTVRIDDESRDALAGLDAGRIAGVAEQWAGIEEFAGDAEAENLAPLIADLSALAGRARAAGDGLYCWVSV